ncbi:unnamed protein product [Enterobius vermicularis]|uniref:Uncharacterized protein n=1 Tax=Enterobius vermicularis TaxID=51028 RepID=A0A0N4VJJ7_ENTVE|nr:unnamed protein product [Enterobius vermicularis]
MSSVIDEARDAVTSRPGTTAFVNDSSDKSGNSKCEKTPFSFKISRVRLPSIQKLPVAAKAPSFVQQFDHASKAGRKKFVEAVTRELLMNRSNRLKRYSYSSSSDEEISETMERVVI